MNRITVWEIARLLPPTGMPSLGKQSTRKILMYTFKEIPENLRQEQINLIPWQQLDKHNIDIENPKDIFKMLMRYRYEFLTKYFTDEIFEKQIKSTSMWQDQIVRHKYKDLKRYCELNNTPIISLYTTDPESSGIPHGNKYNIADMDFHTFDTYYKQYPIFREMVDIYNRRFTRKAKLLRRMRGIKTRDGNRPNGYYNA